MKNIDELQKNDYTWRVCDVVTLMAKHLVTKVNKLTLFLYTSYKKWCHMTSYDIIIAHMMS